MSGSAAPRILLSRTALTRNAQALLTGGGVVDLRHDAFGHGLDEVAPCVVAAGADAVLVSSEAEAHRLQASGLPARTDLTADVDVHGLFGIADAGGAVRTTPVMSLQGRVLATKPLLAGEAVSYGYTHRAAGDTRVALVTGGYAQGIVRALGNRTRVEIGESTHPIVGRIAMDVCVVDLEAEDVPVDAPVTYFGGSGAMRDALAQWSSVTGFSALELAAVIGQNGERSWQA